MKHNNFVLFAVFFLFAGMSICRAEIPEFSIQDSYLKAKELFEKERYTHAKNTFSKIIDYYTKTSNEQNNETFI